MPSGDGGTESCKVIRAETISALQDYKSPAGGVSHMSCITDPSIVMFVLMVDA
ncbi:hypothetical protein [Endozoicomonas montiporae]|nr:hypothetical protein [Endozoicomonas montiporae]